jgi:Skp family chaperone for outer membrane proteins
MSNFRSIAFARLALCGLVLLPVNQALAEGIRIATVEMTKLLGDSNEAKAGLKKIEAFREKAESELKAGIDKLRPKAEKLQANPEAVSASDKADFRQQERELQRLENDRKEEMNKQLAELRRSVLTKAMAAVRSVAEEQKLDLVLYKSEDDKVGSPVLYGTNALDITDEVLKRLK